MSTMMFPIEDGIPMPQIWKYPWSELERGQSFLVPCPADETERKMNSLTSSRNHAQKKLGRRFALRRTNHGIRVWRVL